MDGKRQGEMDGWMAGWRCGIISASLPLPQLGMDFTYKFVLSFNLQHLWIQGCS